MRPGDAIAGRYEILKSVRSGGLSVVFQALDRRMGRRVALKIITVDPREDALMKRIDREIRILSSLSHPHVVACLGSGTLSDGRPYLVLEWLEGEDLADFKVRAPMTLRRVLEIVRQVADALATAHASGIIHRDIKPANIYLVRPAPQGSLDCRVIDFGVAKVNHWNTALTRPGALLGTPSYMAPEQASDAMDVDERADVFSLGVVFFELLTGRLPWGSATDLARLARISVEQPLPVSALSPDLPPPVAALVDRMLKLRASDRLSSAQAAAERADALYATLPASLLDATYSREAVSIRSLVREETRDAGSPPPARRRSRRSLDDLDARAASGPGGRGRSGLPDRSERGSALDSREGVPSGFSDEPVTARVPRKRGGSRSKVQEPDTGVGPRPQIAEAHRRALDRDIRGEPERRGSEFGRRSDSSRRGLDPTSKPADPASRGEPGRRAGELERKADSSRRATDPASRGEPGRRGGPVEPKPKPKAESGSRRSELLEASAKPETTRRPAQLEAPAQPELARRPAEVESRSAVEGRSAKVESRSEPGRRSGDADPESGRRGPDLESKSESGRRRAETESKSEPGRRRAETESKSEPGRRGAESKSEPGRRDGESKSEPGRRSGDLGSRSESGRRPGDLASKSDFGPRAGDLASKPEFARRTGDRDSKLERRPEDPGRRSGDLDARLESGRRTLDPLVRTASGRRGADLVSGKRSADLADPARRGGSVRDPLRRDPQRDGPPLEPRGLKGDRDRERERDRAERRRGSGRNDLLDRERNGVDLARGAPSSTPSRHLLDDTPRGRGRSGDPAKRLEPGERRGSSRSRALESTPGSSPSARVLDGAGGARTRGVEGLGGSRGRGTDPAGSTRSESGSRSRDPAERGRALEGDSGARSLDRERNTPGAERGARSLDAERAPRSVDADRGARSLDAERAPRSVDADRGARSLGGDRGPRGGSRWDEDRGGSRRSPEAGAASVREPVSTGGRSPEAGVASVREPESAGAARSRDGSGAGGPRAPDAAGTAARAQEGGASSRAAERADRPPGGARAANTTGLRSPEDSPRPQDATSGASARASDAPASGPAAPGTFAPSPGSSASSRASELPKLTPTPVPGRRGLDTARTGASDSSGGTPPSSGSSAALRAAEPSRGPAPIGAGTTARASEPGKRSTERRSASRIGQEPTARLLISNLRNSSPEGARSDDPEGHLEPGLVLRDVSASGAGAFKLFGRGTDVDSLRQQVVRALAGGAPGSIAVTGAAGLGKTRVRNELAITLRALPDAPLVLAGRAEESARSSPFAFVARMLAVGAEIRPEDPDGRKLERLRALLPGKADLEAMLLDAEPRLPGADRGGPSGAWPTPATLQAALLGGFEADPTGADLREPLLAYLARGLRISMPGAGPAPTDLRAAGDRARRAFDVALSALAARQGLAVLVDDAHLIDESSALVLAGLVRPERRRRVVVVAFGLPAMLGARAGERSPLFDAKTRLVDLAPLDSRASRDFARHLLRAQGATVPLDPLVSRAQGNPLHLEQLVRAIEATGVLQRIKAGEVMPSETSAGPAEQDPLPPTVAAAVAHRLARLPAGQEDVLAAAAVYGETFWVPGVAKALQLPIDQAEQIIDALLEAGLLRPRTLSRYPGQREVAFAHGAVRTAVLSRLKRKRRHAFERAALEHLQASAEKEATILALHAVHSGQVEVAATFYADAAATSMQLGCVAAAASFADEGLLLSEGGVDPGLRSRLLDLGERAALASHDLERAAEIAELRRGQGDGDTGAARLGVARGVVALRKGAYDEAGRWADQAIEAARHAKSSQLEGEASLVLGLVSCTRGDLRAALRAFLGGQAAAIRAKQKAQLAQTAHGLALIAVCSGDYRTGEGRFSESLALASEALDGEAAFAAALGLAAVARLTGDADLTRDRLQQALGFATDEARWLQVEIERGRLFGESGASIAARETFARVVRACEGRPDLARVAWSAALAAAQLPVSTPPAPRPASPDPPPLDEQAIAALLEQARAGAPALGLAIDVALAAAHALAGRNEEALALLDEALGRFQAEGAVVEDEPPRLFLVRAQALTRTGAPEETVAEAWRAAVEQLDVIASRLDRPARRRYLARQLAIAILTGAGEAGLVVTRDAESNRIILD